MKLLVLAQTPPPVHGQSVMVQALVEGLPAQGVALHHVNFRLSRDTADIGRWRPGKLLRTLVCALRAVGARFRHGCDTLYYVPAPPEKRGALYRDWLVMAICRPFFPKVVLHWHAAGLAEWLERHGSPLERGLTRLLLGRVALSIALAESLRGDSEWLRARRVAVVPNGIQDPGALAAPSRDGPFRLLFLALCREDKGVLLAAEAVVAANTRLGAAAPVPAFALTAAGDFDDPDTAARFHHLAARHPEAVRHVGFVTGERKRQLFAECHALCLPTRYSAEGQPLVALEALAHDRPVIASHWRALPEIVTEDVGALAPPGDLNALVAALLRLRERPPAPGVCRRRFEAAFTLPRHLARLADVLKSGG